MFEVLMFLFENYMDSGITLLIDSEKVAFELEQVGFHRFEIDRALTWLDGLQRMKMLANSAGVTLNALRHYLPEESERLGIEGQGFLLYLEQINVLDPISREIAIDRIMALESREVDIGRIKWVVLMVLYSQPERKAALALMQDMVLADAFDVLH